MAPLREGRTDNTDCLNKNYCRFLGVRTSDGLYRFYGRNAFGMPVGLAHHLFAAAVDREKTELAWRTWLDGLYA